MPRAELTDRKRCVLCLQGISVQWERQEETGRRDYMVKCSAQTHQDSFRSTEEDTFLVGVKEGFLEEVMWHLKLRSKKH